ncbi:MarR family winged helix-turn-helix transcriptional regulator [Flagellimonas sp.]|uniref:MarR family winged helix-turn-helix transcriptional regulator n=1 Tax=Flagellimonas sp. TaxID=2058762 RepID=UPI0034BBF172
MDRNKQEKLKNIEDVILFQLDVASKQSKIYAQRVMDKQGMGITTEQWVILKIVEESGPLTQKEVANMSYRDPASITRTLDLLSKKDFVRRIPVETDRRQHHIVLTELGRQFVKKHMNLVNDLRKLSVRGFSDSEVEVLYKMLQRIRANFK